MKERKPIYIAGHHGLVGAAILRRLQAGGVAPLLAASHHELDLTDQHADAFFATHRPAQVYTPLM